jgi:protein-S-isoprenylcysteine O-methyltransferase Ste14
MSPQSPAPPRRVAVAAALVAAQFALLLALIVVPGGDLWRPVGPVLVVAWLLRLAGLGVVVVGGLGLGAGLTAMPLPNARARLQTGGLYRWVRHPVYGGLLIFAAGEVLARGGTGTLLAAAALAALLSVKARFEERHLRARFPEYDAYARGTPRFLPLPTTRGRASGR